VLAQIDFGDLVFEDLIKIYMKPLLN